MTAEPRAVVLDFDGVVVESTDIKTQAFARLFADGYPAGASEAAVRLHLANVGLSRYEKFRLLYRDVLERPLGHEGLAELGSRFSAIVLEEVVRCPFVPGAPEFLEWCGGAGKRLFLASATPEEELCEIVRRRSLDWAFDGVYGSPTTKAEIVGRILEAEELSPGEVLFVGDTTGDLEAARAAGVRFVGRVPPGSPDPFGGLPDVPVVSDLAELLREWERIVL